MKPKTPQISWHGREPIFSIDFHSSGRVATAGADNDIKIWKYEPDTLANGGSGFTFLSSLDRHIQAVNVVRFSPNGEFLASGGDDGYIFIWQYNPNGPSVISTLEPKEEENKESWTVVYSLRGHLTDVYDLSWSPDSTHLISGSTDNTSIIWDDIQHIKDHNHFIQGVAWDPRNEFVVTQSCDRTVRIYNFNLKSKKEIATVNSVHNKRTVESKPSENGTIKEIKQKLFGDETINTFFRRCSWTPDGSFLILPSGLFQKDGNSEPVNTTFLLARNSLNKISVHLPGITKPSVCVRCNPLKMIFAVATLDAVLLYDTESLYPIAYIDGIHYAELTDLSWSHDGSVLLISSKDGYCTVVTFSENELGEPFSQEPEIQSATTVVASDALVTPMQVDL